jgi:hypothetical protein
MNENHKIYKQFQNLINESISSNNIYLYEKRSNNINKKIEDALRRTYDDFSDLIQQALRAEREIHRSGKEEDQLKLSGLENKIDDFKKQLDSAHLAIDDLSQTRSNQAYSPYQRESQPSSQFTSSRYDTTFRPNSSARRYNKTKTFKKTIGKNIMRNIKSGLNLMSKTGPNTKTIG